MMRALEKRGYRFVVQNCDKSPDSVIVDGREITVPFSNSNPEIILKPAGDSWQYFSRARRGSEEFERELKIAYEEEFEEGVAIKE